MLAVLWPAGPAAGQDHYPPNGPDGGVESVNQGRDGNVRGTSDSDGDGLPSTGAEITMYSIIGHCPT
jgi:hypothetical protein